MRTLALAPERSREASLIGGLEIAAVGSLAQRRAVAVRRASGRASAGGSRSGGRCESPAGGPDLGDVRGQRLAVRALMIAAAGGHNLLLGGAAGTGKTMLAQRLPSILPPLDDEEAIEVTRIRSLLGGEVGELCEPVPSGLPTTP